MNILSKTSIHSDLSFKGRKVNSTSAFLFASSCFFSSLSYANDAIGDNQAQKNRIDLGGAIRMRFDYDPDRDIRKFSFDTAIVILDFYYDQLSGHFEHRILGGAYPYTYTDHIGDVNFTKKAYLEYAVDKGQSFQVGLNQVPIGFQPYYTSTVIESMAYIAGIEDLYRLGVKYNYKNDNHKFLAGYYAANPWKGKGTSNGAYYSNQIISADDSLENGTHYKEQDALALQYSYTEKMNNWTSNYGVSGYYSKLKSRQDFVVGSAFTFKKNLYIATEWLFGKNNPYIGGSSYGQSLAAGGTNQWENQINMNIGYYF